MYKDPGCPLLRGNAEAETEYGDRKRMKDESWKNEVGAGVIPVLFLWNEKYPFGSWSTRFERNT